MLKQNQHFIPKSFQKRWAISGAGSVDSVIKQKYQNKEKIVSSSKSVDALMCGEDLWTLKSQNTEETRFMIEKFYQQTDDLSKKIIDQIIFSKKVDPQTKTDLIVFLNSLYFRQPEHNLGEQITTKSKLHRLFIKDPDFQGFLNSKGFQPTRIRNIKIGDFPMNEYYMLQYHSYFHDLNLINFMRKGNFYVLYRSSKKLPLSDRPLVKITHDLHTITLIALSPEILLLLDAGQSKLIHDPILLMNNSHDEIFQAYIDISIFHSQRLFITPPGQDKEIYTNYFQPSEIFPIKNTKEHLRSQIAEFLREERSQGKNSNPTEILHKSFSFYSRTNDPSFSRPNHLAPIDILKKYNKGIITDYQPIPKMSTSSIIRNSERSRTKFILE
jgi:hypothetical protein